MILENLKQKNRLQIVDGQVGSLNKVRDGTCRVDKEKERRQEQSRGKPRIKEDIQLVSSREESINRNKEGNEEGIWTKVFRRKDRREREIEKDQESRKENTVLTTTTTPTITIVSKEKDLEVKRRKLPKTAAISIKGGSKDFSYAEALQKARTKISLEELGISTPRIRKGINESVIIEVSGPNNSDKANKLAGKLRDVLKDEAYVSRPTVKGELRIIGLQTN